MRRFKLAQNGPEVSAIAYGVWRLADDPEGASTRRVRKKIDTCLEAGITTFDHADIYGLYTCEGIFGAALAEAPEMRERMEIVTKCGIRHRCNALPDIEVKHYDATKYSIEACVDRSLTELRTDYIDVLLIHRPDWLTSAEETAEGLQSVMDAGKVRSVGVSNYSVSQYELLVHYLDGALVTNQVEINLLHMDALYDGTLDQCQRLGAHPMAWSPLAGGRLLSADEPAALRTASALKELASTYERTPDQIALAWVAALPSQPQIIIGTNQPERIVSAAESDSIKLSRSDWYSLWESAQGHPVP
jgi:predicted oxidoreductase